MGRGRAKAKQTKVARQLKYHSPNTDLAALQRELASNGSSAGDVNDRQPDNPDYLSDTDDEDEDDTNASSYRRG